MALEKALEKNTEAVNKLMELIRDALSRAPLVNAQHSDEVDDSGIDDLVGLEDSEEVDYDKLKTKLVALMKAEGNQAPKKIMAEFKCKKLSELNERDYKSAYDKALKALEKAKAA